MKKFFNDGKSLVPCENLAKNLCQCGMMPLISLLAASIKNHQVIRISSLQEIVIMNVFAKELAQGMARREAL